MLRLQGRLTGAEPGIYTFEDSRMYPRHLLSRWATASSQTRLERSTEVGEAVVVRMIAAEATIREPDLARLVTQMTRSQILAQVATSVSVSADADVDRTLLQ